MEKIKDAFEDGFITLNPGKDSPKRVHLFNCDNTYSLDSVEKLFCEVNDDIRKKLSFDIELPVRKNYFPLSKMSEMCETINPKLRMDLAVFVVHAHESRLSINEDNAGIGYAKIYRALLKATGENVLVVIGGDDQYRNTNEEERSVISRWARRKISSQFKEQFMDGRKSFIFSWNKKHREIHKEALLHYFDWSKKGQKFEYQPRISPEVSTEGKESGTENKNIPREGDDRYQEQEVKDNADRGAESSSSVEKDRQASEMKDTSQQRSDTEMLVEETQPRSFLADYVDVRKPGDDEDFESFLNIEMQDANNAEVEAAANNTGVQPETPNTGVETLLVKTRLRHGKILDSDDDKVVWNERVTPPDDLLSNIYDKFKNVAEADMEIYRVQETGVIRIKIIDNTSSSMRLIYAIIEIFSNAVTWIIDETQRFLQLAGSSEGELKKEEEAEVHREKTPTEDLQRQLREMTQQLTSLQGQFLEKEGETANLQEQVTTSERQLRIKDQKVKELEMALSTAQQTISEREEQLTSLQGQFLEKQGETANLQDQVATSERQLRTKDQKVNELEMTLSTAQQTLSEREQQLTSLQGQFLEKESETANLQEQIATLERQLTIKDQEGNELEMTLSTAQQTLSEIEQQLTSLQGEFREKEGETANLQEQVTTLEQQLRLKDQEVNEMEMTLSATRQTLQRRQVTPDWVISRHQIQLTDKLLGSGGWGSVVEGKYCGCSVAVKQLHEEIICPYYHNLFEREMDIASRCRYPCLLQFIGATNDEGSPLLVTELMESSLRALLKQRPLAATEVSNISLDVARALNYLHQKEPPIIHRDISSANVLLWRQGDQWRGKVSDYGSANFMQLSKTVGPGAPIYMAPEARTSNQTVKVDVYSFGVLLCEMCIQESPDPERRDEQIAMVANRRLRALIRRCLQTDPQERPNMEEIIQEVERPV